MEHWQKPCLALANDKIPSEHADDASKKVYDTWSAEEQKLLVQLWCENFERLNCIATRKATWEWISEEINNRLGRRKTIQKCMRKMKYIIERYKDAKEWNARQTGNYCRKSIFYDEIDAIMGNQEAVPIKHVVQAAANDTHGEPETSSEIQQTSQHQARSSRKKARKRQRLDEQEEQDMLKQVFSDLREQRSNMKDFMATFNQMQSQQMETMNTFLSAMTQFLQQSCHKE